MQKSFMFLNEKQVKDAGMAAVLLCILAGLFLVNFHLIKFAAVLLVVNMIWPPFFRPFAVVWFGLSKIVGTIMSKILLSIVFIFIVCPVGLFRRCLGYDPLKLKQFKKETDSVMLTRNHTFTPDDVTHLF